MTEILLYHYSKNLFDELKTLKASGVSHSRPLGNNHPDLGNYNEHISFFFEPIPYDILGSIFKRKFNDVWYTGSQLYEYIVKVSEMPEFKYRVVESPTITNMYYDPHYDNLNKEEYIQLVRQTQLKMKEIGFNKKDFISIANKYIGLTRQCYIDLPNRPNWDKIKNKYAATVPHVMIYPQKGIIEYSSYKKITINGTTISALKW